MNEIIIVAEIMFFETAKESFNFPITNNIRISFWLSGDDKSTFSEILVDGKKLEVNKVNIIQIKLLEQDFLQNRIIEGSSFNLGIYPAIIAEGKVIKRE